MYITRFDFRGNSNVNTNINQSEESAIYNDGGTNEDFNLEESDNAKKDEVGSIICNGVPNLKEGSHNKTISFNFCSCIVNEYFKAQNDGFGGAFLVGYSQFQLMNIGKEIKLKESHLELIIASLVSDLGCLQRQKLSDAINCVCDFIKDQYECKPNKICKSIKPYHISLPATPKLIRSRYTDGKFSLLNNLPFPKVHTLKNRGYISIVDIVKKIWHMDKE